jgi:hypothetical protein
MNKKALAVVAIFWLSIALGLSITYLTIYFMGFKWGIITNGVIIVLLGSFFMYKDFKRLCK